MEKINLFNGKNLDGWKSIRGEDVKPSWTVEDGVLTVLPRSGNIYTETVFGDCMLHLEWMEPDMPDKIGQSKGNSGVFLQGRYEIQVLDSYGIEKPKMDDCGGIYSQLPPLTNACKPALVWQSYDILFRAPRFDADGNVIEHARITVLQNGLPIHNNAALPRVCPGGRGEDEVPLGPLMLQDHGDPVSFRNIWMIKL